MSIIKPLIIAMGIVTSFPSLGKITILKEHSGKQDKFGDLPCELEGRCGLKNIFYKAMHKKIDHQGTSYYSTDFYFGYETGSVDQIENFAIVQMIKGCQWSEYKNLTTGEVERHFNIAREYYGGSKVFVHKDWEIDNVDANPFYSSFVRPDSPEDKFGLLRWNKPEDGLNVEKSIYYFRGLPEVSKVYVTDLPGASYSYKQDANTQLAKNSTLDFKTCLLPISAVNYDSPSDGSGVDWSKAIACFSWNSSKVFDWDLERMIEPVLPDSTCSEYSVESKSELL